MYILESTIFNNVSLTRFLMVHLDPLKVIALFPPVFQLPGSLCRIMEQLWFSLLLLAAACRGQPCPKRCMCQSLSPSLAILCSKTGLLFVPGTIERRTVELRLQENFITGKMPASLSCLTLLKLESRPWIEAFCTVQTVLPHQQSSTMISWRGDMLEYWAVEASPSWETTTDTLKLFFAVVQSSNTYSWSKGYRW